MEWHEAIDQVKDHTVKVITPQGHGTGFFIGPDNDVNIKAIATAAHVVNHAHSWQQPIKIQHAGTKKEIFLENGKRYVIIDFQRDTASIIFSSKGVDLGFPNDVLPFIEKDKHYKVGVNIGWLGFPAISSDNLCFFSGRISCWQENEERYLVDGVAINGVSGGPAFTIADNKIVLMGLVTNYIPNHATGISTPGLCVIRDVSHARKTAPQVKNIQDSRKNAATEQPPQPIGGEKVSES